MLHVHLFVHAVLRSAPIDAKQSIFSKCGLEFGHVWVFAVFCFARRLYAVFVILLALGVFSSFISSITSAVNTLRAVRMEQMVQDWRYVCMPSLFRFGHGKLLTVFPA